MDKTKATVATEVSRSGQFALLRGKWRRRSSTQSCRLVGTCYWVGKRGRSLYSRRYLFSAYRHLFPIWLTMNNVPKFPPSRHLPIHPSRAFDKYSQHSFLTGNSTSHFYVGWFHATGYGNATEIDQKRALLEWTFSAHGEPRCLESLLDYWLSSRRERRWKR